MEQFCNSFEIFAGGNSFVIAINHVFEIDDFFEADTIPLSAYDPQFNLLLESFVIRFNLTASTLGSSHRQCQKMRP